MSQLEELVEQVLTDTDITAADVPQLDLYLDQVLALAERGLSSSKRHPEDKALTKTMVHNYSKAGLLLPVKGKKYPRPLIFQLLLVYHLKQSLSLSDVKALAGRSDIDFEACYEQLLGVKQTLRETMPDLLTGDLTEARSNLSDPESRLMLCLELTAVSTYLRRLCEKIIDTSVPPEGKRGSRDAT